MLSLQKFGLFRIILGETYYYELVFTGVCSRYSSK